MNTREIASEYRLSQRAGIVRERTASGMSIREFCRRAGYQESVYFYWQRKLREAACTELAARTQEDTTGLSGESLVPNGWAVYKPTGANTKKGSLTVEIGKYRVLVEEETDTELLTKVCRTLMSLC